MTNSERGQTAASASFSASLKHILLVKVAAERKPPPTEPLDMRPSSNVNMNIRYGPEGVEAFFAVSIKFPNPEKPFCTLDYTIRGVFEIEPTPTRAPEHQRIVSALVTSLAWPYLREYAESAFHEMKVIGPLPLPYTVSVEEVLEKLDMTPH